MSSFQHLQLPAVTAVLEFALLVELSSSLIAWSATFRSSADASDAAPASPTKLRPTSITEIQVEILLNNHHENHRIFGLTARIAAFDASSSEGQSQNESSPMLVNEAAASLKTSFWSDGVCISSAAFPLLCTSSCVAAACSMGRSGSRDDFISMGVSP
jgi:hypothetical protein